MKLKKNQLLVVIAILMKIFDVVSTYILAINTTIENELNPIIKWLMYKLTIPGALLLSFTVTTIFLVIAYEEKYRLVLQVCCVILGIVMINNGIALLLM